MELKELEVTIDQLKRDIFELKNAVFPKPKTPSKNPEPEQTNLVLNMRGLFNHIKTHGWDLDKLEVFILVRVLTMNKWNKSKTASQLGISWQSLDRRMVKFGITDSNKQKYKL